MVCDSLFFGGWEMTNIINQLVSANLQQQKKNSSFQKALSDFESEMMVIKTVSV